MPQKVMIHVHGNLPDAARPTVGNGLRARQLGAALSERNVAVSYLTHARFYPEGNPPPACPCTTRPPLFFNRSRCIRPTC